MVDSEPIGTPDNIRAKSAEKAGPREIQPLDMNVLAGFLGVDKVGKGEMRIDGKEVSSQTVVMEGHKGRHYTGGEKVCEGGDELKIEFAKDQYGYAYLKLDVEPGINDPEAGDYTGMAFNVDPKTGDRVVLFVDKFLINSVFLRVEPAQPEGEWYQRHTHAEAVRRWGDHGYGYTVFEPKLRPQ